MASARRVAILLVLSVVLILTNRPAAAQESGATSSIPPALRIHLDDVQRAADELAATHEQALGRVRQIETDLATLRAEVLELESASHHAQQAAEHASVLLTGRAVDAYVQGGSNTRLATVLSSADGDDLSSRLPLLENVLRADESELNDLRAAAAQIDADLDQRRQQVVGLEPRLAKAQTAETATAASAEAAQLELADVAAGRKVLIPGLTFPVDGPHSFVDSWGASRMEGTAYAHTHVGTDILAPMGTPLVALERGEVLRLGTGTLGGIKLWLKGDSGTYYYYAHLSDYAAGIADGTPVEAGTVVGYVGDTGNASGGPPHVHFEVHPDDGAPVNPYPLLVALERSTPPLAATSPSG